MKSLSIICLILTLCCISTIESKAQCNTWPVPCGNCICVCTANCSCSKICPVELSNKGDQQLYDSLFNVLNEGMKSSKVAFSQADAHEIAHKMNAIVSKEAIKQPSDRLKSHIGEKK